MDRYIIRSNKMRALVNVSDNELFGLWSYDVALDAFTNVYYSQLNVVNSSTNLGLKKLKAGF